MDCSQNISKVWFAVPCSRGDASCLHSRCMSKTFYRLSVKVGDLFQVQDRNLRGSSDSSMCSSLFVSCDLFVGLWAAYVPPLIFARLPVYHLSMATHAKLIFPEQAVILLILSFHNRPLAIRVRMLSWFEASYTLNVLIGTFMSKFLIDNVQESSHLPFLLLPVFTSSIFF